MKSLLKKFAPGVALAVLTVAIASVFVLRAQTTPAPAVPPKPAAVDRVEPAADQPTAADVGRAIFATQPQHTAAPAAAVSPVTICGVCGARIEAPQPVYVAQPVAGQGYGAARAARDFIGGGNLTADGRFVRADEARQAAPQTVIVYVVDPNRPLPVPELPLLPVGIMPPPIPAQPLI